MACFFGNAIQESGWFGTLQEVGAQRAYWYYPWHGRGLLQLTHPYNYKKYWQFRGRAISQLFNTLVNVYQQVGRLPSNQRMGQRNTFQDDQYQGLNQYYTWRDQVASQENIDPVDSAGFYWASLTMAQYADELHTLERVTINANHNLGMKVYYRSLAFWRASAAVNLPARINAINYRGLNGLDQRCSVYGNCLAVLTEMKFPDAGNNLNLEFPAGYTRKNI